MLQSKQAHLWLKHQMCVVPQLQKYAKQQHKDKEQIFLHQQKIQANQ